MLVERDHAALVVLERVGQAACLGAIPTVGAAAVLRVGNVALPGKRHAQRAMDEELDGCISRIADCADFLQVQLAGQDQL